MSECFIKALADDLAEYGIQALEVMRQESSAHYQAIVAKLCPQDVKIEKNASDAFVG